MYLRVAAGDGGLSMLAEFAPHVGAHDFVVSPPGYWLYTQAMPRVLNVMRRRHHMA